MSLFKLKFIEKRFYGYEGVVFHLPGETTLYEIHSYKKHPTNGKYYYGVRQLDLHSNSNEYAWTESEVESFFKSSDWIISHYIINN